MIHDTETSACTPNNPAQADPAVDGAAALTNPIIGRVSDVEAFGQAYTLMMSLSRYLDTVAAGVLGGNVASPGPFVARAVAIYQDLRATLLDLIEDEAFAAEAAVWLRSLDGVVDPLEAALVVDQTHTWLETTLRHGTFTHKMRLMSMQIGLEAAAATAQLSEQQEKVNMFQLRRGGSEKSNGTYL